MQFFCLKCDRVVPVYKRELFFCVSGRDCERVRTLCIYCSVCGGRKLRVVK